jgi:hypothetical protein
MQAFTLVVIALIFGAQARKPDLIQSPTPFTKSSEVDLEVDPFCAQKKELHQLMRKNNELEGRLLRSVGKPARPLDPTVEKTERECAQRPPYKKESGTLNGVTYQFHYSDGSGTFTGLSRLEWKVACEKDPITDEKTCYMDHGDVRVWVDGRGRSEIYIGDKHYPGSQVVIRIDKGSPMAISSRVFNGSFGYRASPAIINRIAAAKIVTTRYQEWPHTDYVDDSWEPHAFAESLSYIRWAVRQIK